MFLFVRDNPPTPVLLGIAAAETVIELALVVGLGLLAAHSIGSGAPILEKWLRNEPFRSRLPSVFLPALLVGASIGAWSVVPHLPLLHPNRQAIAGDAEKLLNSSARTKVTEVLKRTSGRTVTSAELMLSYACEAVSGELTANLFFVSGIAWILTKVTRTGPGASRALLWIAVILAVAVGAGRYLAWQATFERLISGALGGIRLQSDPFWLVTTRRLLGLVPAGVGLGWLYIRRGLESAMIGSLIGSAVGYAATTFLLPRLY